MSAIPRALRDHAARYLAQRLTTSGHLGQLLLRGALKREPETTPADHQPAIAALLDELRAAGVLDDDAWVASRVRALRRQGNSPAAIRAKLAAKRVPSSAIDAALADAPDADLVAALHHLRKRRLGPWAPDGDARAALAKLGRAGFSFGIARRAVEMPLDEALGLLGR